MPKRYPSEFQSDVVMVARRRGMSQEKVASHFPESPRALERWMKQDHVDDGVVEGQTTTEQQEVLQLRRDSRRLQQEVEILRRASAYCAKDAAPK